MFPGKVFCVGMNKSGTSTVGECLRRLGFEPFAGPREIAPRHRELVQPILARGDYEPALGFARDFRGFKDRPWNLWRMPERLDERFPDSRFILTVRDPESWWRSIHHWMTVANPRSARVLARQLRSESIDREAMVAAYLAHNEAVLSHFAGTGRLLVMDFARGDGWDRLCPFLDAAIPPADFPRMNRQTYTEADRENVERWWREGDQPPPQA
jgi:hypothetical protein